MIEQNRLKPIETHYKGYRFRSRLEARWAVFFDVLGIEWEYELEGFDLGNDIYYLPDFWLPKQELWIEVKPKHPHTTAWLTWRAQDEPLIERCTRLSTQGGSRVAILTNDLCDLWQRINAEAGEMVPYLVWYGHDPDDSHEWCICPICHAIDITYGGRVDRCYCGHDPWKHDWVAPNYYAIENHEKIQNAYSAARSARFEHGERPQLSLMDARRRFA